MKEDLFGLSIDILENDIAMKLKLKYLFTIFVITGFVTTVLADTDVYLEPYETPTKELFFKDFNGDGKADMAVRTITGGTNGEVDVYFNNYITAQGQQITNGDFETGDFTGWTKTGTAFNGSPTQQFTQDFGTFVRHFESKHKEWYVNTHFVGETAIGTLTSNTFTLTGPYIHFRIGGWSAWGGGGQDWNYVTLHRASDGLEIDRVYTLNTNHLRVKYLDGSGYEDEQVYVKVTDNGSLTGFSWIEVDHFRIVDQFDHYTFNSDADITSSGVVVNNTTDWGLFFADINGDGNADLVNHNRNSGDIFAHYNTGSSFVAYANKIYSGLTPVGSQYRIFFHDIDGNGYDDYCVLNKQTGYFQAYRNISESIEGVAYISQTVGTPSYPFNGNETLLADLTGDGKVDFVNFDQTAMSFTCYKNLGTSFDTNGKDFESLHEKYEHQYFLEDFDGDNTADMLQFGLRRGDIVVHNILPRRTNGLSLAKDAFFRYGDAPGFTMPSEGRDIINDSERSVNVMMLYEIDRDPEFTYYGPIEDNRFGIAGGWRHDNGWQMLNPNNPDIVPEADPCATMEAWRTTTPLLGLYTTRDPEVIKQHAYWMHTMGVDALLLDWTNLPIPLWSYTLGILEIYNSITEFVPPKITVGYRMQEAVAPFLSQKK